MSRIDELEEKISKYEEILKKALGGPYAIGKIVAGPSETGLFRVQGTGANVETILPASPKIRTPKLGDKVLCSKEFIIEKLSDKLEIAVEPVKFDFIDWEAVGGMKSQIERIRTAVEFPLLHAEKFKSFNVKPVGGIMLYGPPGCGKTLIAKAIASTILRRAEKITNDSFVYLKGGEMLSPFVGVAENNIKEVFERCRRNFTKTKERSVIFIDEAEAILPARGSRMSSDVETTIVPTFLSEMDGFEQNNSLIILATNHLNQIDPAILRPGRIDLKIAIEKPSQEDTHEIFEIYFKRIKTDANAVELAHKSSEILFNSPLAYNVSGAMISSLVQMSSMEAMKRQITDSKSSSLVTIKDIEFSINHF